MGRSSGPQVLTRAFLLTVSPRDPVTQALQVAIVNYIKLQCQYGYVVTENGKSGKLHLHALLVFSAHRDKKKLQENINNRIVQKNGHPCAKNGVATLVTCQYDHKWYDEYLRKEDSVHVLYDNYNREAVTSFFPEPEVQEFLQTHRRTGGPVDKHMAEHKRRWIEFSGDGSYESAIKYLKTRMYVLEDMIIIQDKRRLTQMAYALFEYRNQIVEMNAEENSHKGRMDGYDFRVPH